MTPKHSNEVREESLTLPSQSPTEATVDLAQVMARLNQVNAKIDALTTTINPPISKTIRRFAGMALIWGVFGALPSYMGLKYTGMKIEDVQECIRKKAAALNEPDEAAIKSMRSLSENLQSCKNPKDCQSACFSMQKAQSAEFQKKTDAASGLMTCFTELYPKTGEDLKKETKRLINKAF